MIILMFQVEDIYIRTTAIISNFWPRNGERGHLNNTTRSFYGAGGMRHCSSLSRYFEIKLLNKTLEHPKKS